MNHRLLFIFLSLQCLIIKSFAADTDIRLNSLGFFPSMEKSASIAAACTKFSIVSATDGSTAFSGTVTGPKTNYDTDEAIYTADFSALTEPGRYYLSVDGVGKSPEFPVGNDIFDTHFITVMRAMYLWRCGTAVTGTYNGATFRHAACHMSDAYQDYVGGGRVVKPSIKGWHDAGDFNKYVVNAGITVGAMFFAWEQFKPALADLHLDIPESGGPLPDYLAEIKWELDWLLTTQFSDGTVSHKVSATGFCGNIMPESENSNRYFVPWGSAATADFVAMMAMASRIYKPYDETFAAQCLAVAVKSYTFLAANPADHRPDQSGFTTGAYGTADPDDRLWAAAEMWETTGEQKYLADFETRAKAQANYVDADFDWSNVKNLGMYTYLLSERTGKDSTLHSAIKTRLLTVADTAASVRNRHGYKRALGGSYYWGCNGSVVRQSMLMQIANTLSPDNKYLNAALDAIGHVFGRNYYCRSFVTGIGINPPQYPHDRRSMADKNVAPWPGYIVGGTWPDAKSWIDVDTNYQTNEIAINWQAALIYAMAGFLTPPSNAVRPPLSGKMVASLAADPHTIRISGIGGNIRLPAGQVTFFDCRGRTLKTLTMQRAERVDLQKLGIRQGAVIIRLGPAGSSEKTPLN